MYNVQIGPPNLLSLSEKVRYLIHDPRSREDFLFFFFLFFFVILFPYFFLRNFVCLFLSVCKYHLFDIQFLDMSGKFYFQGHIKGILNIKQSIQNNGFDIGHSNRAELLMDL